MPNMHLRKGCIGGIIYKKIHANTADRNDQDMYNEVKYVSVIINIIKTAPYSKSPSAEYKFSSIDVLAAII